MREAIRRVLFGVVLGALLASGGISVAQTCSTWCRQCDETPKLKGCTAINGKTAEVCGNAELTVPMGCVCVAGSCVNDLDPTNVLTDPAFFQGCPSVVGAFCN